MALDTMLEEMIRTQAKQQIASFQAMGASLPTITEGLAIALEEFAAAYKSVPEDVLQAVELALKDREWDRREAEKKAAERKAAVPRITESLLSMLGGKVKAK